MFTAALHGFILAFPLIMPLGVQNVFIFNQGASEKRYASVLPVVLTAAVCDTILISLAVMGVSVVIFGSVLIKTLLITIGSGFLIYMGWITWNSVPETAGATETAEIVKITETSETTETAKTTETTKITETIETSETTEVDQNPLARKLLFTASVSILNPHAIMDTIGVIGTSSLAYQGPDKFAFALATVLVSWIWFFSLSLAGRITGKLDQNGKFIKMLNKISGCIMWGAAVFLLLTLLK